MLIAPSHPPERLLAEFLLGNLPDAESEQVEQHLETCRLCTQLALKLTARDDLTELIKSAALSPGVAAEQSKSAAVSTSKWSLETFSTLDSIHLSVNGLITQDTNSPAHKAQTSPELPAGLANHPRYRVLRCIGQGGMGVVWLAEHQLMHRLVVLKSIRAELHTKPQAIERFSREVQAISRLNHPNIVAAYDAELIDDSLYLVIEYVEGETLGDMIKRGPLSVEDACRYIAAAARGLEHAHKAGIVHRDVKPNNIILSTSGQVKVLDFGLAGLAEIDEGPTVANLVMGTPDYISPEQASRPTEVDARADIYSLGCTFYHLLTGRVPFAGTAALVKIDAHRHQAIERPEAIPEYLWSVVSRMLAKDPQDRYQSAGDVAQILSDLERLKQTPRSVARVFAITWRYITLAALLLCVITSFTVYRPWDSQTSQSTNQLEPLVTFPGVGPAIEDDVPLLADNRLITRHQAIVSHVCWSLDGQRVLSAGYDGTLRETDVTSQKTLRIFDLGNQFPIRDMEISQDNQVWLSTTEGIIRFSLSQSKESHEQSAPTIIHPASLDDYFVKGIGLTSLALAPNSDRIAWGDSAGLLSLWDIHRQSVIHQINLGAAAIYEIAWSQSAKELLVAGDFGIALIDASEGKFIWHFPRSTTGATRAMFSRGGTQIYASHWGGRVEILEAERGYLNRVFESDLGDTSYGNLVFSLNDDRRVITTASDCTLRVWDTSSGKLLGRLSGHGTPALTCSLNSQGWLASGAEDGTVRVWQLGEQELPQAQLGFSDQESAQVLMDGDAAQTRNWLLKLPADYGVIDLNRIAGLDSDHYQAIAWRHMANPSYALGINTPWSMAKALQSSLTHDWKTRSQYPMLSGESRDNNSVPVTYLLRPVGPAVAQEQHLSRASLAGFIATSRRDRLRPVSLALLAPESQPIDDTREYHANLQPCSDVQWDVAVDLSSAELDEFVEATRLKRYRPMFVQGFGSGPSRRYACVTVANRESSNWQVDIAVASSQWPSLYQQRLGQGLRPRSLSSQMVGDEMLITVLWLDKSESEVP